MKIVIYIREKKIPEYERFKDICLSRDIPVSRQIEKMIEQYNKKFIKKEK